MSEPNDHTKAWAEMLEQRVSVKGELKRLGNCTEEDLQWLEDELMKQAAAERAFIERLPDNAAAKLVTARPNVKTDAVNHPDRA